MRRSLWGLLKYINNLKFNKKIYNPKRIKQILLQFIHKKIQISKRIKNVTSIIIKAILISINNVILKEPSKF